MSSSPVSLRDLVLYFARLGAFGFGGSIAPAGYIQHDLVPCDWLILSYSFTNFLDTKTK